MIEHPAQSTFENDPRITTQRLRLYKWFLRNVPLWPPKPVKMLQFCQGVRMDRADVRQTIEWLKESGYVEEHPPEVLAGRTVRRFTVTLQVDDTKGVKARQRAP